MRPVIAALLAAVSVGCGSPAPLEGFTPPGLTEDSPGWDCRIHGNRICGSAQLSEGNLK
jgi:hypothetical protein